MKKENVEAAPMAVEEQPAEAPPVELPIKEQELDSIGALPVGIRPAVLGRDGKPLSPEAAKVFYDQLVLTDEMKELGAAANIDERTLLARAREFHSCHPDQWREMFLADLIKWGRGEMPTDEKLRRGLIHAPERRLHRLQNQLLDKLNVWRPEDQVPVFEELIDILDRKIAELKSRGAKGARYGGRNE